MKKLPVDVSDFETLITENYLYIDKTEQIDNLLAKGRLYFLSRPRRFGKSLLISTIKQIFAGNKRLFEDLWIGKYGCHTWTEYPIIYLDFSTIAHRTPEHLEISLSNRLSLIAKSYGITLDEGLLEDKTYNLITQLAQKGKIVLLVDEYDKPLLDHIDNIAVAEQQRAILHGFYDAIKGLDAYFHAIFITGVTKFAKTSIFSGMNNLNDISLLPESSTLLGYTIEEIRMYFELYIEEYSKKKEIAIDSVYREIKIWYNGYRFSKATTYVYNPFSILYYLKNKDRANYWFTSGTPSFLVNLLKKDPSELSTMDKKVLNFDTLNGSFNLGKVPPLILLQQAGYLTIKDYNEQTNLYTLGFPNEEVQLSMSHLMLSMLANIQVTAVEGIISQIKKALNHNDLDTFCSIISGLLANIPYDLHVERESYYHSLLHFMALLLGVEVHPETHTSKGRIDLAITMPQRIFIFEFKFNKSAQEALQQIINQRYHEKYLHQNKPLTLVGISFNYKNKELILDWISEPIKDNM